MMFPAQKEYLRAIVNKTDRQMLHYFPRQMGKTYAWNLLKKLGKVAVK